MGNSLVLKETALIEAFNLKAAIEYQMKNFEAAQEALSDMPPRSAFYHCSLTPTWFTLSQPHAIPHPVPCPCNHPPTCNHTCPTQIRGGARSRLAAQHCADAHGGMHSMSFDTRFGLEYCPLTPSTPTRLNHATPHHTTPNHTTLTILTKPSNAPTARRSRPRASRSSTS